MVDFLMRVSGDLSLLSSVIQLTVFRLEVKIKKKETAGPNFGYSEIECALRSLALQMLFHIIAQLPCSTHSMCVSAFAAVGGVLETLDQSLCILMGRVTTDIPSERTKQERLWALTLIDAAMAYRAEPPVVTAEAFRFVCALAAEEALTSLSLHILISLAKGPNATEFIMQSSTATLCLQIFDAIVPKLNLEPVAPSKGKPAKDKKPDKSGAAHKSDAQEKRVDAKDPRFALLLSLRLLVHLLHLIASRSLVLSEDLVPSIVKDVIKVMGAPSIWELLRSSHEYAIFVDVSDLTVACVELLGALGELGEACRRSACRAGAALALHELMQQSHTAVGLNSFLNKEGASSKDPNLAILRSSIERSMLLLLTEKCESFTRPPAWTTCGQYLSDNTLLTGPDKVLDVLSLTDKLKVEDVDLGNRYLRLFTCLLMSCEDQNHFVSNSTSAVSTISSFLLLRSSMLLEVIKADLLSSKAPENESLSGSACDPVDGRRASMSEGDVPIGLVDPPEGQAPDSGAASRASPAVLLKQTFQRSMDELVPSHREILAMTLLALEPYVKT